LFAKLAEGLERLFLKTEPEVPGLSLPETDTTTKPKTLPPYNVILLNDDFHSMEFVVAVLQKVFGYNEQKAFLLMLEAHHQERAIVWSGSKEGAELKQEQVRSFHETRDLPDGSHRDLGPLGCDIEPAC
jgi:ATP-dependent Clp protease adaptor protein ClpS